MSNELNQSILTTLIFLISTSIPCFDGKPQSKQVDNKFNNNLEYTYPFEYTGSRFFNSDKLEVTWSFDHESLPNSGESCNNRLFFYQVQKALLVWARYANINFKYIEYDASQTEIFIKFGTGKHNCACIECDGFDGRNDFTGNLDSGSLMAHAFPARSIRRGNRWYKQSHEGELHIDFDEPWTFSDNTKTLNSTENQSIHIIYSLIHELGHVLGLDHVDNPDSIMYYKAPFSVWDMNHKVDVQFPDLGDYDIKFITGLYGGRRDLPRVEFYTENEGNGSKVLLDPWNPRLNSFMEVTSQKIDLQTYSCWRNFRETFGFEKFDPTNTWVIVSVLFGLCSVGFGVLIYFKKFKTGGTRGEKV